MNKSITTLLSTACLFTSLGLAQTASAHGYIQDPPSRTKLCATGANQNCGAIQWEPQSAEGPDRYPETGPADGSIASAGNAHFSELDEQTANRWSKTTIQPGPLALTWYFTANHASRDYRYFLTKPGWNPNQPLSRDSFDPDPFCTVDANNEQPPQELTHDCYLPENRSGYHVILGVWDVADTVNSFYQVVDVVIDGDATDPAWTDVGDINPATDLAPGDSVQARVFDERGEIPERRIEWTVDTAANGDKNTWPMKLAEAINNNATELRAGQLNNGEITPGPGKNDVFATEGSPITRVETRIITDEPEPITFNLNGVMDSYEITDGIAEVSFNLTSQQNLAITAELYDAGNRQVARTQAELGGSVDIRLAVDPASAGDYNLVVIAKNDQGRTAQQNASLRLTDPNASEDYDFVFPKGLDEYQAGTRVLARDGGVYQCKPYPYDGWCGIYSQQSPHYEPGYGSNWADAWVRID